MRQPTRFALLIVLGGACWYLFWLSRGKHVGNNMHTTDPDDFRSRFRSSDVVDEHFETRLYNALSSLEQSLRRYDISTDWPKFIWQTSPTKGDTPEMNSWKIRNPDWSHRHYNDAEADSLVEGLYQSIPEILHVYKTFPLPVLRADLFRYLVLFAYGGVYADADVHCAKPIVTCVPPTFWSNPAITTIVGIEIDEPSADESVQRQWKWSRNHGFTQWTVITKPFAEPLKLAIVRAVSHAYSLARLRGVSAPGKLRSGKGIFDWFLGSYSVKDILEVTGPGMWTDAVLDSINGNPTEHQRSRVSWSTFTSLQSPKLAGHILVLPINYFGSGQRHSKAGNFQVPEACVNHLAKRTWK